MTVLLSDLKLWGSQVEPDDDAVQAAGVGGAIDRTKRLAFFDVAGFVQLVSSTSVDTTQQVTAFGRDGSGAIVSEVHTLTGQTPVTFSTNFNRLLKGLKNALTGGDIALEAQTPTLTGSLAGATLNDVTLPAAASAVDGTYNQQVLRMTGTSKAIRRVINYVGASRLATVDHPFTRFFPSSGDDMVGTGDAFRLAGGFTFEKNPAEVIQVRRPFYNAASDAPGGVTKTYYEKGFWENTSPSSILAAAQAIEASDPFGVIDFGLAPTFADAGTNGAGNTRQIAPGGIVFASTAVNVPGGTADLRAGSTIGIWFRLTLPAGAAGQNAPYVTRLSGTTA